MGRRDRGGHASSKQRLPVAQEPHSPESGQEGADVLRLPLERRPASGNIMTALSGFVGREEELARVRDLLEHSRLVTLTGPPGIGKTRLAVQVANEVADRYPTARGWSRSTM